MMSVSTKKDALQVLRNKQKELSDLLDIIKDNEEMKKEYSYLSFGISKLIDWIISCDQLKLNEPCDTDNMKVATEKVVRYHGFADKFMMSLDKIDAIFCGGIFLKVPVYILPVELVNKMYKNSMIDTSKAFSLGLPTSSEANYGTIRQYDGEKYIVVKRTNTYLDKMIYTASRYEMVYMQ